MTAVKIQNVWLDDASCDKDIAMLRAENSGENNNKQEEQA